MTSWFGRSLATCCPSPTFEQRLATGFCRNHMINGEGGRIAEENRVEYVLDQMETVATGINGADPHLRSVSRPQVRSADAAALLRALRVLQPDPGDGFW